MKSCVLILVGPSAVGKTTVATEIVEKNPAFSFIRSLTTRPPRGDGRDDEYIYTDREGFLCEIERRGVLEHTEYDGMLYGTPRSEIERVAALGKTPLLVLDINGAESFKRASGDISPCILYLTEKDEVLRERLAERYLSGECPDEKRYKSRLSRNAWERENLNSFSHLFYRTIEGEKTPALTAEQVISAFLEFKGNLEK